MSDKKYTELCFSSSVSDQATSDLVLDSDWSDQLINSSYVFPILCQNALIETLDHNQIEDFALLRHQTPRTKQQRIVGH